MNDVESKIVEAIESRFRLPVKSVSLPMNWKGYDVYGFRLDTDEIPDLGGPSYVLVKGDMIRFSCPEEGYEILRALPIKR